MTTRTVESRIKKYFIRQESNNPEKSLYFTQAPDYIVQYQGRTIALIEDGKMKVEDIHDMYEEVDIAYASAKDITVYKFLKNW